MSERLRSFRELKRKLRVGRNFDFSKRKSSASGSTKFKKQQVQSTKMKKTNNLKFWNSNRSESSDLPKSPKSEKRNFKTPFSPSSKLKVVSARKVTLKKFNPLKKDEYFSFQILE